MADKRPDQTLPLVIYKSGERIVIGAAVLKGDGSIEAQIAKDVKEELKDLFFGNRIGDFSINPKLPVDIDRYHGRFLEAAYTPPIKIQDNNG